MTLELFLSGAAFGSACWACKTVLAYSYRIHRLEAVIMAQQDINKDTREVLYKIHAELEKRGIVI